MEEPVTVLNVVVRDLQDLRAEMREGFYRVHERLDQSLTKCADDCPKVFVGKGDFATLQKWVKANCWVAGVLVAIFLLTHGEQTLTALDRIMRWL